MNIIRMTLITGRGADRLLLYFDGLSGSWPYTEPAVAIMEIAAGGGATYAFERFPRIPLETIDISERF